MVETATDPPPTEGSTDWYGLADEEVCRRLDVEPLVGLSATEVAERRQRYGPNKLAEEAKEPAWQAWVRQYRDLMQLVLVGAAVVSIVALQDISTGVVVLGGSEGAQAATADRLRRGSSLKLASGSRLI